MVGALGLVLGRSQTSRAVWRTRKGTTRHLRHLLRNGIRPFVCRGPGVWTWSWEAHRSIRSVQMLFSVH